MDCSTVPYDTKTTASIAHAALSRYLAGDTLMERKLAHRGWRFLSHVLPLWPTTPIAALPICVGIYAIAWDIGFVSFITPSGLGFREGAIGLLFALALPVLPTSLGAIIALLSRFVSTLAEVPLRKCRLLERWAADA